MIDIVWLRLITYNLYHPYPTRTIPVFMMLLFRCRLGFHFTSIDYIMNLKPDVLWNTNACIADRPCSIPSILNSSIATTFRSSVSFVFTWYTALLFVFIRDSFALLFLLADIDLISERPWSWLEWALVETILEWCFGINYIETHEPSAKLTILLKSSLRKGKIGHIFFFCIISLLDSMLYKSSQGLQTDPSVSRRNCSNLLGYISIIWRFYLIFHVGYFRF